jgi:endonuclease/exonuclease/phosphatase family metal-dependent hydrolase
MENLTSYLINLVSYLIAKFFGYFTPQVVPTQSPTTMNSQASNIDEIKMLTYNVFMRPPLIHSNKGDFKNERLTVFIEQFLHLFDIVCLQEMFCTGTMRCNVLKKAATTIGLKYSAHIGTSYRKARLVDGGIMILSRYPIVEVDRIYYTKAAQSDALSAKGVLSALIQIKPDVQLLVITTHLQAEYPGKSSLDVQASQLMELKNFLVDKQKQYPNVPMVLCGDFNIGRYPHVDKPVEGHFPYHLLSILSWEKTPEYAHELLQKWLHEKKIYPEMCLQRDYSNIQPSNVSCWADNWRDLVSESYPFSTHSQLLTYGGGIAEKREDRFFVHPLEGEFAGPINPELFQNTDHFVYYNPEDRDVSTNISSRWKENIEDFNYYLESGKLGEPTSQKEMLIVKPGATQITPFWVNGYQFPQLSDHYGLQTTLQVVNKELYQRYYTIKSNQIMSNTTA